MDAEQDTPWPTDIRLQSRERRLEIAFDNGYAFSLSAEYLRVESPSAEVKGHSPSQAITIGGKRGVGIDRVEPVGNYAIRICFDDGHDTGLYSWALLYRLGSDREALWRVYLEKLKAAGLSRDA
jgi:DUF971 family protein